MKTIRKSASVKVMLSYNYNHFEASIALENEKGVTIRDIDDARKDCNRLCDKAIIQYRNAKIVEQKRLELSSIKRQLEREIAVLKEKNTSLTVQEKAKIKVLDDHDAWGPLMNGAKKTGWIARKARKL